MTLPYIYEILLYAEMFLDSFKTDSVFHSYYARNKSDLFVLNHNTKLFDQSTA